MATLQAEIKRGFLRSLARNAATANVTLAAALASFQDNGFNSLKNGRFVIQSSGGGFSTSFAAPSTMLSLRPEEVFAFSEELFATYEAARQALIDAGNAVPSDAQIAEKMLLAANFQSVKSTYGDYSLLRVPNFIR